MLAYFFYPYYKFFSILYKDLTLNVLIYVNVTISLSVTNKTCGMVSRAKAKRGEQTHAPQCVAMAVQ